MNVVEALKNAGERLKERRDSDVFPVWEIKGPGLQFRLVPKAKGTSGCALARLTWEQIGNGEGLDKMMKFAENEALASYISVYGPIVEANEW